tara:strand:+ start:2055 stop:2957 length:903 start_codon:yes stop_codon:yes gene_type:complete
MKKLTFVVLTAVFTFSVNAQNKKEKDQKAITDMCGCYEVGFNFAETFSYSKDSIYQTSKIKHDKGLEWVQLVEDKDGKIVMQHLLIVGKPNEQSIIKHWRQDWLFENTDFYMFDVNNKWKFLQNPKSDVKGQWTQKVFQVDDSPRYEGSASWVHVDGKSYWENTTDAPLPRREYTKRQDYDVTIRTNRHEITKEGWIHDQDNDKVIRKDGDADFVLAQEKGLNTYVKVADSKCKSAQDWWKENQAMWQLVRNNWDNIFAKNQDLELKQKVEDKRLYELLFALETTAKNEEINKIITDFVK